MASDRLTPVMQLMVSEGLLDVPSPAVLTKRLSRGLMKDMFDQALYTLRSWPYEDHIKQPRTDTFRATLGAGLDPFAAEGKCGELRCRVSTAERFARSVALYVDQAIIPDPITATLTDDHRTAGALSHALYSDIQVLKTMRPLIADGIVRFGSPVRAVCDHCKHESERLTEEGVKYIEELLTKAGLSLQIAFRRDGNARLSLICPKMFWAGSHELIGTFRISKEKAKPFKLYLRRRGGDGFLRKNDGKQLSQYIRRYVLWLLGNVMYKMSTAAASGSTFASGSRVETAFLSFLEGRRASRDQIVNWESLRSVELPWVRELSAAEIVRLRHEAGPALSQLRASFAARLNSPSGGDDGSVANVVSELRSQAVEVENELAAYRTSGGRRAELVIGRAALAFVVYGVMADAPTAATALATALTVLATMHGPSKEERIETERLKARAPYVLVRAKELLTHRK